MSPLRTLALSALLAACAAEPRHALAHGAEGPARAGPWSLELTDEWGRTLPTFEQGGRTFALGEPGDRYLIRVRNGTGRRAEVVVSVDGRDVVDGQRASWDRRGYLVEPWGQVTVEGFRLSQADVAAFRFSSVARSYAAAKGDARDVGVIGVAVFPERAPAWRAPPSPWPYPPPGWSDEGARPEARSEAAPAPGSAAPREAPMAKGRTSERPGLGTELGERHGSQVEEVPFERASGQPAAILTLRYDDRRGLLAAGVDVDRWAWSRPDDAHLREHANPFRANGPYAEPPPGWRGY